MSTLEKYIKQIRGISYKPEEISEMPQEGFVPILKANNITENGLDKSDLIYIHKSKVSQEQFIKKGDLLLAASSGSKDIVGKHIFFDRDYNGSFGAFCKVVRPNTNIFPEFVSAFFKTTTYRRHIRKVIQGANINNLKNEHIDNLLIPEFNRADQIKISIALRKAQALIKQRREGIILIDEFLKSTFLKMFGEENNDYINWEKSTIKKECQVKGGKRVPKGFKLVKDNTGHPYIKAGNIKGGKITLDDMEYLPIEIFNKLKRYTVNSGDVCITVVGVNIGDVGIVPEELDGANLTENANKFLIKDKSRLSNIFLSNFLSLNSTQKKLLNNIRAAGVPKLALFRIEELDIVIPPIDLQNQFAAIIEKADALKEQFNNSLNDLENLYGSLSQRAFKGELDFDTKNIIRSIENDITGLEYSRSIGMQAMSDGVMPDEALESFKRTVDELTKEINDKEEQINILIGGSPSAEKKQGIENKDIENIPEPEKEDKRYGDPFEVDEETAKKQGGSFYKQWKKLYKEKKSTKISWDKVSTEQVTNWIKEAYNGFHFTSEMLIRFLMDEHVTFPDYYSSEELKKNPKANDADDLKTLIFSSLNNENPFLKLEQVFYNPETENINLTLRDEDFELIKDRSREERTGVYMRIAR